MGRQARIKRERARPYISQLQNPELKQALDLLAFGLKKEEEIEQLSHSSHDEFLKNWDELMPTYVEPIKEAGRILFRIGGHSLMQSDYIWNKIPREQQGVVDFNWDGIGEWRG